MFLKCLILAAVCCSLVDCRICHFGEPCDRPIKNVRSKRQATRNYEFAGDTLTIGFLPWLQRDTSNLRPPVTYYQIGPNGRTEVMSAHITSAHLNTGTATNAASVQYARSNGNNNDDAGHILASRLGGSGTDLRNIFPQSLNINRGVWAQAEAMVDQVVRNQGSATYTVNLEYRDRQATRPYLIVYQVEAGGRIIVTNDVVNP